MPLYAGVAETNVTPPPDVWMGGYAGRDVALGVHDELFARALVLDNGEQRLALLVADLVAVSQEWATRSRRIIAQALDIGTEAVMLHCTHTHGGPYLYPFRGMGHADPTYEELLQRKLLGVARQAAESLQPASLTYGESSAQIGINRRQTIPNTSASNDSFNDSLANNQINGTSDSDSDTYGGEKIQAGKTVLGRNYGGPVSPSVQTLCINSVDGRTFGLLFCHACHPTTQEGNNRYLTADWPGAAVAHLKARFRAESADTGIAADALPFCLQGCCGDINPLRRGDWEAVASNGRIVADAAHTARWNAHGRMSDALACSETTLMLPLMPPPPAEQLKAEVATLIAQEAQLSAPSDAPRLRITRALREWAQSALDVARQPHPQRLLPFTIQKLTLGGATLLGFPAEMFVQYQLDLRAAFDSPLFCLGYTNGCHGYLPTASEYPRGGYEIEEAHKYYGTLNFSPECEELVKRAVAGMMSQDFLS